ncbi:hypothetical protein ABFA07_021477 [Porites harrisoni]
MFGLSIPVCL